MNNKYKGIIASNGIAIGKAYIFNKTKVDVVKANIEEEQVSVEVEKIKKAIADYDKQLNERLVSSEEEQAVIDAHKELLADPYLIETIENKISGDKVKSDWALKETIEEMVSMMEMLDDEYLKERAADYKDIGERIMYELKGIKAKSLEKLDDDYIVISEELTPSDTSTMDKAKVLGFAMNLGGKTSHTSIIAQTLSIPALVGMKNITENVEHGDTIILDSMEGIIITNPSEEVLKAYSDLQNKMIEEKEALDKDKFKEAITKDDRKVEVACNIGNLEDLELGLKDGADGVGLFRTEFLYMDSNEFPSEEKQFEVYKKAAERLEGKPLIIRTLDIGGDKSLSYFEFPKEENPFLGWRALRICFDKEEVFRDQLRAILRASAYGNVKILLPMVISVEELERVNELLDKYMKELSDENIEFDANIEVGVMIETPASVFIAEELIQHCDYFSIGTNDLTQYILAVDRGNENISHLYNNYHPAVLRAMKKVIDASHKAGKWTGMCGSMASDTKATYLLLGMGLDEFSSVGSKISKIKNTVLNANYREAEDFANKILSMSRVSEIEKEIEGLEI